MGNFNVRFDVALNYNDPEFRFIYVNAVGKPKYPVKDAKVRNRIRSMLRLLLPMDLI